MPLQTIQTNAVQTDLRSRCRIHVLAPYSARADFLFLSLLERNITRAAFSRKEKRFDTAACVAAVKDHGTKGYRVARRDRSSPVAKRGRENTWATLVESAIAPSVAQSQDVTRIFKWEGET